MRSVVEYSQCNEKKLILHGYEAWEMMDAYERTITLVEVDTLRSFRVTRKNQLNNKQIQEIITLMTAKVIYKRQLI